MRFDALSTGETLALVGGVTAAIAAFLPWFSVNSFAGGASVSGLDHGDGLFTLLCGLVAIGLPIGRESGRLETLGLGIAGALICLVGYHTLSQVSDYGGLGGEASVSYGLYLTMTAGVLVLGGAILAYRNADDDTLRAKPRSH